MVRSPVGQGPRRDAPSGGPRGVRTPTCTDGIGEVLNRPPESLGIARGRRRLSRAHGLNRRLRKGRNREMSNTVELTKENFDEIVPGPEGKDFVFIDFWAEWCGPCRQFAPVFEKAAERHPDLVFAKVDTEAQQELAAAFGIQSIPTLAIIREGVLVFSQPGALPEATFEDLIGQARKLDMAEVKRKVEAEQKAAPQA
ncbi:thioredoxin [Kitasatospora sp. CM 4170]|uniref:Thioredoxin n=1 Tax=Kitasatospora aburaviensis TaxID=67265 RepID=A0ABW1EUW9_9ACTN|nr:thioredoxin [Kitasatospora sp. CM 4170]WNM45080.1 thioredoxin [Kitasatospora sp. CM 4170]